MRGLPGQRKGVSGILGGVILFAMLFSVGIGFYVYINQTNNATNQANVNRQNLIQQSSLENLTLSATQSGGTITVTVTNRGGISTTLLTAFLDNSNGVLQNPPSPDPFTVQTTSSPSITQPTLNVGQSASFNVPGYSYTHGNVTVSVITGRGNTFTAQYPPPKTGTLTQVVVNSQTTNVVATVSGGGSNALVVVMTATPPVTFSCSNGCVTDNITVYNYALSSVTGVALAPNPPSVVVCGTGNTPGCTASLTSPTCTGPSLSNGQPDVGDSISAYSGSGNAPYVIFECTYNAQTGAIGGFATFSGEASGTLSVTGQAVSSATATSNTIEIGGQANVITQGAFTANFLFYKYSACQTAPQETSSSGGHPVYQYTGVTTGAYPCNPTPTQITNHGTMNDGLLNDAYLLYSAANYYVGYYVSITNDFNQTLPILQYSYLYMDPGISGEQYYFLAGAATDYYNAATKTYSSYYPNYNVAGSVPTLDAYSATTTTCAETYNAGTQNYTVPSPSTCINVHPGQTLTLTFAACGWDASTWDWGGTEYAQQFDAPATNCNINSVPGYQNSVPEGQVVSIELTYMYKNQAYSQLLPFDGQFILNQYTPSISTQLSSTSIQAGQSVTDSATLSSASPFAGGTVQYEYFASSTCSGSATDDGSAVTVTDGAVPNSPAVTFSTAGSYGWEAVYSGDSQNTGATSPCEPLTVTKATPTIATTLLTTSVPIGQPLTDSAALSSFSGTNVGGTISFYYSTTNSCPTAGATQVGAAVGVSSTGTATSSSATFSSTGTYYWYATYSGDSNNAGPVTSACEPLTVTAAPSLTVSPTQGPTGTATTLTGSGYSLSYLYSDCLSTASASVSCVSGSTSSFTSTAAGAIPASTTVTVPSGTAAGTYYVIVYTLGSVVKSATFTVTTATISLSPTQGLAGKSVTVTGSGFSVSTPIGTFTFNGATPGTQTCTSQTTSGTGTFTCTFTVPASSTGAKTAVASGNNVGTVAGDTASTTFTVTTPSITLTPSQGPKGITVSVSGSGYNINTAISTFTFNGATPGTQTCTSQTTSGTGTFTCTFTVPSDSAAGYTVTATASDGGTDTASATFTITTPAITLSPTQGPKGITVTVSGSGYTPSTAISTFTFNGATPGTQTCTSQTTSGTGTFTCTFTVPSDSAAAYTVVATGSDGGSDTASTSFTITTPAIALSHAQGPKGISITVTGSGFTPSTTIGTFTFGGATPATQTCTSQTTTAAGAFSCTFTVPSDSAGGYTVTATGSDSSADSASTTFTITTPAISLSPAKGAAGTTGVSVSGSGYTPSTAISTFTFNGATPGTQTCTSQTTSGTGTFTCTFTVPSDTAKTYTVVATGSDGGSDTASTTFVIPGVVQSHSATCTSTSCSVAFSSSVTAGDELVIAIGTRTASTTCSTVSGSVTDSVGTYTVAIASGESSAGSADCAFTSVYYIADTSYTGADTVSFTLSSSPTSAVLEVYELAGVASAPTAADGKGTTSTAVATSSLATTANAVLIAVGEDAHASGSTTYINAGTSGFTASYDPKTAANPEWVEYEYPASAGSTTFGMTITGSVNAWSDTGVEFAYDAAPATTALCTSATLAAGSAEQCTAYVTGYSGSIAGEVVSWSQVSGSGSVTFVSPTCSLSATGTCSVTMEGAEAGDVSITATYSGDQENSASTGTVAVSIITSGSGSSAVTSGTTLTMGWTAVMIIGLCGPLMEARSALGRDASRRRGEVKK